MSSEEATGYALSGGTLGWPKAHPIHVLIPRESWRGAVATAPISRVASTRNAPFECTWCQPVNVTCWHQAARVSVLDGHLTAALAGLLGI
jgi:hypothetical protein